MRSADRHSRGDFWSWRDRTEVRSAEVTGRPHGRNQGEKLASTQRSHNFRRVRTTGKWTFGAQSALLGSRHKDHVKAFETHVDHFWRRPQRGPHARRCSDRVATPLRDAHRQRSAHQRDLRSGAALEPSHIFCETCAGDPELGRKYVAGDTMERKAGLITFCSR